MHLLDKFIIVQFGKDDFIIIGHVTTPCSWRRLQRLLRIQNCGKQLSDCEASATESITLTTTLSEYGRWRLYSSI